MSEARRGTIWRDSALVFAAGAAVLGWLQFLTPYIPEEDGYFHIKFAWLLRHQGLFRNGFPWSHFSLWRDAFSDGAPLYHLYLAAFTFGDLAFGVKLATALLGGFLVASFFAILTLNGVRSRWYWMLLLALGGGPFWWRMLAPRPQVLSAALLLWSVHFIVNERRRAYAAISVVYPLCYVAAFLPQIVSVARWGYQKVFEKRADARIVVAGFAGFAVSMLVHPYFPKNLLYFYVQDFYTFTLALTKSTEIYMAREMMAMDTRLALGAHAVLLAHLLGAAFCFVHEPKPLSARTRETWVIALVLAALACASRRFVEYAVPVGALFLAFLFDDLFDGPGFSRAPRALALAWLVALGGASVASARYIVGAMSRVKPPRFEALSKALSAAAPAGDLVFTCDWDEPPELLYFDSSHRFPVMMDPTFMYYRDPVLWKDWHDLSNGYFDADRSYRAITEEFGAHYGLCGAKSVGLRAIVGADKRFEILAEDPNGFVFRAR